MAPNNAKSYAQTGGRLDENWGTPDPAIATPPPGTGKGRRKSGKMDLSDEDVKVSPSRTRNQKRRIVEEEEEEESVAGYEGEDAEEDMEGSQADDQEAVDEDVEEDDELADDVEEDVDIENDDEEESRSPSPPPPPPPPARGWRRKLPPRGGMRHKVTALARSPLKIKFKMPPRATATPASEEGGAADEDDEEDEEDGAEEDGAEEDGAEDDGVEDDGAEDDGADEDGAEESSEAETMPQPSKRLTARQAALLNGPGDQDIDISLDAMPSRKRKQELNEIELALKREETARKRRNLSEKRLEDEKTETINRLLRKQSRARNRRNALASAEDREQPSAAGSDAGEDGSEERAEAPPPPPPVAWRWVSSARPPASDDTSPTPAAGDAPAAEGAPAEDAPMDADAPPPRATLCLGVPLAAEARYGAPAADERARAEEARRAQRGGELCAVDGCGRARRYRVVHEFARGACGMAHLKLLQGAA